MSLFGHVGQISVLWPHMLWLLAPLPLLIVLYFWLGARQRQARATLTGLWALTARRSGRDRLRRALPPLLYFIGLVALVGAVARPQAVVMLPSLHRDIILAIDHSGSMSATDIKPNRLSAAQSAARTFIESQPRHSRIGIVSIAGTASVVQSPTDNREDLVQALERLKPQRGTALGSGIYIALATLLPEARLDLQSLLNGRPNWGWSGADPKGEDGKKVSPGSNRSAAIVLLSDGESNHGPEPLEAAKLAADYGVRIYTVGVGSKEGFTLSFGGWSMRVSLDEDMLRQIAATTLGEYYAATSTQQLTDIYERLSARMVVERSRTIEVTAFLVATGALLLVISALCSIVWFNRVL
jgi:Ca-activated chloride channel family protein